MFLKPFKFIAIETVSVCLKITSICQTYERKSSSPNRISAFFYYFGFEEMAVKLYNIIINSLVNVFLFPHHKCISSFAHTNTLALESLQTHFQDEDEQRNKISKCYKSKSKSKHSHLFPWNESNLIKWFPNISIEKLENIGAKLAWFGFGCALNCIEAMPHIKVLYFLAAPHGNV